MEEIEGDGRTQATMMPKSISEISALCSETGVGLVLKNENGKFIFGIAGTRERCSPGELFYGGIGGRKKEEETWVECAHREASEEAGTAIELISASEFLIVDRCLRIAPAKINDTPKPLAFYEMAFPASHPRYGITYGIIIYQAIMKEKPRITSECEYRAFIALTPQQVIKGIKLKRSVERLLSEGAELPAAAPSLDLKTKIYPTGTAAALAAILSRKRTCF